MASKLFPAVLAAALCGCASTPQAASGVISTLPRIATVDERYQSYNVEMVEVTGGRFWAAYGGPEGEMYRQRPPEDLAQPRLRALARALGPAYVRVSGTWANSTYLEAEGEHLSTPPPGFGQLLTRDQWRGVVAFAKAADARIGVSFAVSAGTRGPGGVWKTDQAQRLLDLTREAGGEIAFAEFINEPIAVALAGVPKDYSVADYTRDFKIFREWAARSAPKMKIVGPGSVGEGDIKSLPLPIFGRLLLSDDLMKASPNSLDAVSYHFYGDVSQRCARASPTTADKSAALSAGWLDRTLRDHRYYSVLRDAYEPGDPLWLTETAQAACGGSPWAASFLDTFRYVNQLGLLAQHGVQVVMHNTLTASDYALIEEGTLTPRPNYWAALLWRRTMGTTVLAAPAAPSPDVRLYTHCLRGKRGGVGLVALNLGEGTEDLTLGGKALVWTLEATPLDSKTVRVNGSSPTIGLDGALSGLDGAVVRGRATLPAKSVTYIAVTDARNRACN